MACRPPPPARIDQDLNARPGAVVEHRPSLFRRHILPLAFATLVFFPWLLVELHALRPAVVAVGVLLLLTELHDRARREAFAVTLAAAIILIPTIYLASIKLGTDRGDLYLTLNIQRGLVLLPLFCMIGWQLYDSAYRTRYARAYVSCAVASSAIALPERLLGRSLLGRDASFDLVSRDGQVRAVAGSEHVLVLGTLICVAVAIVSVSNHRFKLALCTLLILGCWSTGSLGPTIIAVIAVIVGYSAAIQRSLARHMTLYVAGTWIAFGTLAYLSMSVWSTTISGLTGRSFSTEYRFALYASLPSALKDNPLGVGLGELPSGVWQFAQAGFQTVDLARSIDSELAHLGLMFGVVGVGAFIWLFLACVRVMADDIAVGLPMTALCAVGLVLSLHSWDTLTPVWFIGIGLVTRSRRRGRKLPEQPVGAGSMRGTPLAGKV